MKTLVIIETILLLVSISFIIYLIQRLFNFFFFKLLYEAMFKKSKTHFQKSFRFLAKRNLIRPLARLEIIDFICSHNTLVLPDPDFAEIILAERRNSALMEDLKRLLKEITSHYLFANEDIDEQKIKLVVEKYLYAEKEGYGSYNSFIREVFEDGPIINRLAFRRILLECR